MIEVLEWTARHPSGTTLWLVIICFTAVAVAEAASRCLNRK